MNKSILTIVLISLLFTSCDKDPIPNSDGTFPGCIELSGTQSTAIILTNHVTDPTVPDYCISGTYFVEVDLVIEPGVYIQMNDGAKIRVRNGGSFKSVGTETENIKILGEDSISSGQWGNIHFSSNNLDNQLIHTNIYGGGNTSLYHAMVFVGYQGYALIDNCKIVLSSTTGIKTESVDANLGGISNCLISLCGLYPIDVHPSHVGVVASSNWGDANTYNLIEVSNAQLESPATWQGSPFFPYHINGVLGITTDLTVTPGTSFFFAPGARMQVTSSGSLNCIGTSTNRIRFRGDALPQSPGSWDGVIFLSSTSNQNEFDYCDFSYGGASSSYQGMITLWSSSNVKVGNSNFNYSERWGLYRFGGTNVFDDNGGNTWTGNGGGNFN